jgi:hypothetical protein
MHPIKGEVFEMRKTFAVWFVVASVGLAALIVQGYQRRVASAPLQSVARSSPQVKTVPDFSTDPLPVKNVDEGSVSNQSAGRRMEVQPVPVQPVVMQTDEIEAQREQDERLLRQQEVESQRQQQELDEQIEEDMRARQEVQSEQRIQEPPEQPLMPPESQPIPAPPPPQ